MRFRLFKLWQFFGALSVSLVVSESSGFAKTNAPLKYTVSWLGNTVSGASNRWVQNFFIHTHVQPDGTVNTWSHWDKGGKTGNFVPTSEGSALHQRAFRL